jgi:hypothetical protein
MAACLLIKNTTAFLDIPLYKVSINTFPVIIYMLVSGYLPIEAIRFERFKN